ncbi:zinc finger protein OZF-like [Cloeon dipterum]|uniref:zinc finger protein OZF-like n=1 Tax=Cloeon dipterum TaxID=197152 RepID=UPI0032209350
MNGTKQPIQKPLCHLCECPTSDGHVLASQVDRIKLRKWAMKVMNLTEEDENLPEVFEKDDLICYFCIWLAEQECDTADESEAWWPKNLDYLDKNAKVLRENFRAYEVDQCWVQLEKIDVAKYQGATPLKRKAGRGTCLYCGKTYNQLVEHVKKKHSGGIKCGVWGCSTYFHTEEEKERHMQEDFHEKRDKPQKCVEVRCKFCKQAVFTSVTAWKHHITRKHPKLVACMHKGCNEFFKSKPEMIRHVNSLHKRGTNRDIFQCEHCEYYTKNECNLQRHEEAIHMPKLFKCDTCDSTFGSKRLVAQHYIRNHTFVKCTSCDEDVPHGYKSPHAKQIVCSKCKVTFKCLGLYQVHKKSCKKILRTCKECEKSFNYSYELNLHVRKVHANAPAFYCNHCTHSTFKKGNMVEHMLCKHLPKMLSCIVCKKMFSLPASLKRHIYAFHKTA